MFFYKVEGHMQKLSSFGRGKTIRPKKSLTWLLQMPLQMNWNPLSFFQYVFKKLTHNDIICIIMFYKVINTTESLNMWDLKEILSAIACKV